MSLPPVSNQHAPAVVFLRVVGIAAILLLAVATSAADAPRNIILFVGDGFGFHHADAASHYQYGATGTQAYEQFPLQLAMTTYAGDGNGYQPHRAAEDFWYVYGLAVNSASAATAMSTGYKSYGDAIGVDMDGNPVEHIVERLKTHGKATGTVTSVQFGHATPAGFSAHNEFRYNYSQIGEEMLTDTQLDVIMGCGHPFFDNSGDSLATPLYWYVRGESVWNDVTSGQIEIDLDGDGTPDDLIEDCDGDGIPDPWLFTDDRAEFQALAEGPTPKRVLGIARVNQTLQYKREYFLGDIPYSVPLNEDVPTLEEMTRAALNILDNDPDGFFVLIEGGAIDWASHANEIGGVIEETIDFNHSIEAAIEWVETHSSWDETLMIITADHECGYLLGPGSGPGDPPVINPLVGNGVGNVPGVDWFSESHTNLLVPFYVKGCAEEEVLALADELDPVRGRYVQNVDIAGLIFSLFPPQGQAWSRPENIIIMVGEGSGFNQQLATDYYQYGITGQQPYQRFPIAVALSTYAADGNGYARWSAWHSFDYVLWDATEETAAATALSTGRKVYAQSAGLDIDGTPLRHLVEVAKDADKSAGIVTSVPLSDKTAAGLAAHSASGGDELTVARELLLDSRLDLLMGCGHPGYDAAGNPQSPYDFDFVGGPHCWNALLAGETEFDLDGDGSTDNVVEDCNGDGTPDPWTLIETRAEFQSLPGASNQRILGLPQVWKTLQYERPGDPNADPFEVPLTESVPTLAEMATGALRVLGSDDDGFLLWVEAGAIDWACGDAASGRMIEEQVAFNEAVQAVVDWVEAESGWHETLVIVTAARETGHLQGPGSGGHPPTWNPIVNHGAGVLPGMEWNYQWGTNALVPFYAKGAAAEAFAQVAHDYDDVRIGFMSNAGVAPICRWLWEGSASSHPAAISPPWPAGAKPDPSGLHLLCSPNPFGEETRMHYYLPQPADVVLTIFDASGRQIHASGPHRHDAGWHSLPWKSSRQPTGIYFARLRAGSRTQTERLVLCR